MRMLESARLANEGPRHEPAVQTLTGLGLELVDRRIHLPEYGADLVDLCVDDDEDKENRSASVDADAFAPPTYSEPESSAAASSSESESPEAQPLAERLFRRERARGGDGRRGGVEKRRTSAPDVVVISP